MLDKKDLARYLRVYSSEELSEGAIHNIYGTALYLEGLPPKILSFKEWLLVRNILGTPIEDLPTLLECVEGFIAGKLIIKYRMEKGV